MTAQPIVLKYGSSVLANADCLPAVVHDIYRYYRVGRKVLAVVSAIGDETDHLLAQARAILDPPAPEAALAELLASGEHRSAALLTIALARAGVEAGLLTAGDIGMTLRGERLDASPASVDVTAIHEAFAIHPVLVVPGFSGRHEAGGSALLGRGGSDLTAVYLAQAIGASRCRLVKDVDGIYERDPAADDLTDAGKASPARYDEVTYDEALRVSRQLVQPKAISYLRDQSRSATVCALLSEHGTEIGRPASRFSERREAAPRRVALLGLGQVGQGVYRHLRTLRERFEVSGILVRDPGRRRDIPAPADLLVTDLEQLLERPYDILIDVSGDPETAYRAIERSLLGGLSAITASKQLVAEHGPRLSALAAEGGARVCFSAAVGGATPMLERVAQALEEGPIARLQGVLNGTCNFVLDQLAAGCTLDTAVSDARRRGLAEADVSRDLHGHDAADKLRILARAAFGHESDTVPVHCEGLAAGGISASDARSDQGVLRQVASFDPLQGASVKFQRLPNNDYLAGTRAEENRLVITASDGREWRVSGKGAGRWPTAEAVIADLLEIDREREKHDRQSVGAPPKNQGSRAGDRRLAPVPEALASQMQARITG